jgi:hypothetical protein
MLDSIIRPMNERDEHGTAYAPLVEVVDGREIAMYAAKALDYWYLHLLNILEWYRGLGQLNLQSTAKFANTMIDSLATLL